MANSMLAAVQSVLHTTAKGILAAVDIEHVSSSTVTDTIGYFGTGYRSDMPLEVFFSIDMRAHATGTIQIVLVARVKSAAYGEHEQRAWWSLTDIDGGQQAAVDRITTWLVDQLGASKR